MGDMPLKTTYDTGSLHGNDDDVVRIREGSLRSGIRHTERAVVLSLTRKQPCRHRPYYPGMSTAARAPAVPCGRPSMHLPKSVKTESRRED